MFTEIFSIIFSSLIGFCVIFGFMYLFLYGYHSFKARNTIVDKNRNNISLIIFAILPIINFRKPNEKFIGGDKGVYHFDMSQKYMVRLYISFCAILLIILLWIVVESINY